eukprot:7383440-Prymnesium_polylepis.3
MRGTCVCGAVGPAGCKCCAGKRNAKSHMAAPAACCGAMQSSRYSLHYCSRGRPNNSDRLCRNAIAEATTTRRTTDGMVHFGKGNGPFGAKHWVSLPTP